MSERPIGRLKTSWEDDVLEDIKSINVRNLKKVAQNRDSWKKVFEQARNLYRVIRPVLKKYWTDLHVWRLKMFRKV